MLTEKGIDGLIVFSPDHDPFQNEASRRMKTCQSSHLKRDGRPLIVPREHEPGRPGRKVELSVIKQFKKEAWCKRNIPS